MSNAPDLFGFTGFFSNELKDADPDIYNALGGGDWWIDDPDGHTVEVTFGQEVDVAVGMDRE